MKTALAVRHLACEDLGWFETALVEDGWAVNYVEAQDGDFSGLKAADLVVVLGGPMGAYETDRYPFLAAEIAALRPRIDDRRPTLGLCLGAQLLAAAMGALVYPGEKQEIGWAPVYLTDGGSNSPLRVLEGLPVLHWHGDTFDLPPWAVRLAGTDLYENQAFAVGSQILALQFHPEVTEQGLECWYEEQAAVIEADSNLSLEALRADAANFAGALRHAGGKMLRDWLGELRLD